MIRRHFLRLVLCILIAICSRVSGWHDFTNVDYHCWSLDANAKNHADKQFSGSGACKRVHFKWILAPPEEIKQEVPFNTTFELYVDYDFWDLAVDPFPAKDPHKPNIFMYANETGLTTGAAAKEWCENTTCPLPADATEENCCIHHVNVHSCPLEDTEFCGPWIQPSGEIFTHSPVIVGPLQTRNWTCLVKGLYKIGETEIIAHIKFAYMHLAVFSRTVVLPRTVCGNGVCESNDDESCDTCPKDCGQCPLEDYEIALIVVAIVTVVAVICGIFFYFQWQKRKLLWDESWIYPYEQVKEDDGLRGAFGSMISVNQGSVADMNQPGAMMATFAARRQVFATTATVDGRTVAVHKIPKKQFVLTTKIRREVRTVRQIDHPNLCKFVGGCIEVPNVCILMEYCPKGSLNDVLLNEDVPLNWAFRFSFAADIARGMLQLHNNKVIHGRLKSNNCVVDDRWTVKVTDYHLNTYRKPEFTEGDDAEEDQYYSNQRAKVYKAPEMYSTADFKATEATDVYAYAIILVEIATRNDPYGDEDAMYVSDKWKPPIPELGLQQDPENDCPSPFEYQELICQCWEDVPEFRPTFDKIKKTIYKINPNKMSAIDLMMTMMEKYSKHLESVVAERTQDLVAEKQKTDRLLYSMLPKAVAEKLKMGNPINAKKFEVCTIYFSDIVGFTTISGGSTPFEVVALLNKLYVTFDTIIDSFDVYKVETIGDAYMVVSGIPSPTQFHAREVADMSIEIVEACKIFVIPHMPDQPLKIRVGLHTGSACAGVVGLKMPRYCLFGDTVNTASRMESNGEAYRIHMSEFTRDALEIVGGYNIACRGAIPVKGKGDMKTYWLEGHTQEGEAGVRQRKISQLSKNSGHNSELLPPEYSTVVDTNTSEAVLNHALTEQDQSPNGNIPITVEPIIQPKITMFDVDNENDYLFTPVELPSIMKLRKISNLSGSNDSGYMEKMDSTELDRHSSPREIKVESLVDFGDLPDADAEC